MKFLRKCLLSLAIWGALALNTLIWVAETVWLALGCKIVSEPAVAIAERSVINWINWWQWAGKETIEEMQVLDLVKELGIRLMVRAP